MARHAGPRLPLIVKNLIPTLNSVFDSQRITTTAFFAEVSKGVPGKTAEPSSAPLRFSLESSRGWRAKPPSLPPPPPRALPPETFSLSREKGAGGEGLAGVRL